MVEFIIKSIILFVDKLNLHYLTLVAPKFKTAEIDMPYIGLLAFEPRFAMVYEHRVWCHVVGFNRWNRTLECACTGHFWFYNEDSVCGTLFRLETVVIEWNK